MGPEQSGYPEGVDPAAFIAPPRTEYDYSPLDLAPPGQRRKRQLIAGAIGALSVLLIGAVLVFGWVLLDDDSNTDDPGNDRVAAATEPGEAPAGNAAGTPSATTEGQPTVAVTTAAEPTQAPAAAQPTAPPAAPADAAALAELLPGAESLPAGFDAGTDSQRDLAGVVEALGGSRSAQQALETWGWTGNVERTFNVADPAAVAPGSPTIVTVSLHGFKDAPSAAESLPFYSDILANNGYEDVEPPALGETARLLMQPQEDGGVVVALYVQQGPVLYRIGGYAPGGDPTPVVVDLASAMLAGQ
jgi:hypothetical protein